MDREFESHIAKICQIVFEQVDEVKNPQVTLWGIYLATFQFLHQDLTFL